MHAHLAYLFVHIPYEELDAKAVITLISSQLFLNSHHPYNLESLTKKTKKQDTGTNILGIPDTEVFDIFQRHRGDILRWLLRDDNERNEVMEAIVRITTMTGGITKPATAVLQNRFWRSIDGMNCVGRFVPYLA